MFAKFFLTLLALAVALVAAGATEATTGTTTSTISLTQTVTITRCNPSVTNCPANKHNTTTSTHWPVSNKTTVAYPTSYANKTKMYPTTTGKASTVVVLATTSQGSGPTAPATVKTSGAEGLLIQSGLLLSGVAAAIALLA